MFKVVINDGTQELPDDDIYYIVGKEGIFLKKRIGVMESIAPVKNISILQSVTKMARMHINPIPAQTGAKILEFFRAVYDEHKSEAVVILFYNEQTGKYRVIVPKQEVTAASCDYKRKIQVDGFSMIGTIHSHAAMSAFHSGIDTSDEKSFDGLHITFGHVGQEDNFSISASIVSNGSRFIINPEEYLLGVEKTRDEDKVITHYKSKVYKMVNGALVLDEKASGKTSYTTHKLDKRYKYNVAPSKRIFNPAWLEQVEKGRFASYNYGYGLYGGWQGGNYWDGWDKNKNTGNQKNKWDSQHFSSNFWDKKTQQPKNLPAVVKQPDKQITKSAQSQTKKDDECDDDGHPCLTCLHRDYKIADDFIDDSEEFYLCGKCNSIIETDELNPECPTCKTDDHLLLIEDPALKDNFKQDSTINSAQSMQPDQLGMESCPQCGSQFLRLETDECCPFCQTLLPESSFEPEIEFEWECPHCEGIFGESEIKIKDHCPHCNGLIELKEEDETLVCPKCHKENKIKDLERTNQCSACGTVVSEVARMIEEEDMSSSDSGQYLDHTEEEHQQILDAAAEADKSLERIPDPEKGVNQPTSLSASERIKRLMQKAFGGKGNDTIH